MGTTEKINSMIVLAMEATGLSLANLSTRDGWVLTIQGEEYGVPKPLAEYESSLGYFLTGAILGAKLTPVVY